MKNKLVNITIYTFLVLFLYTGLSKLVDFNVFVVQLKASPITNINPMLVAWTIPIMELIIVVMLLIPKTKKLALKLCFLLMLIFTAYVAIILSTSKHLPCSCGGIFYKITWKPHLILNIVLTLMAGWSVWILNQRQKLTNYL